MGDRQIFYGTPRTLGKQHHTSKVTFAFHKPFLSLRFPKNTPESKEHKVKPALRARVIPHLYSHSQRVQRDLKKDLYNADVEITDPFKCYIFREITVYVS